MIDENLEADSPCVDTSTEIQEHKGCTGQDDGLWEVKNERRGFLIDKQSAEGLNPAEAAELRQLQAEIASYLARRAPISFEAVEALEAVARRIGALPPEAEVPEPPSA